jgi:hypothetical protein
MTSETSNRLVHRSGGFRQYAPPALAVVVVEPGGDCMPRLFVSLEVVVAQQFPFQG